MQSTSPVEGSMATMDPILPSSRRSPRACRLASMLSVRSLPATGRRELIDGYSDMALRRVWASVRISWYLTNLLHRFPGSSDFDQRAQEYELEYLRSSASAQKALAEQYAGLDFE